MDLDRVSFRPTRHPGIEIHFYHRDKASGHAAVMIRMAPGASYPRHRHRGPEELLILQGGFEDEHGSYGEGEFVRYEDGSIHHPRALQEGPPCVFFAIAAEGIDLTLSPEEEGRSPEE